MLYAFYDTSVPRGMVDKFWASQCFERFTVDLSYWYLIAILQIINYQISANKQILDKATNVARKKNTYAMCELYALKAAWYRSNHLRFHF